MYQYQTDAQRVQQGNIVNNMLEIMMLNGFTTKH